MATYLDAQVLQIQSYLARSPRLKPMRGASARISQATQSAVLRPIVDGFGVPNPQAGEVDGAISVVLDDGASPNQTAEAVLAHLRRELPGAHLGASWADGETYLEALGSLGAPGSVAASRISLPPIAEVPLARRCEECALDPAETEAAHGGERRRVCADCGLRYRDHELGLGTERRLLDALAGLNGGEPTRPAGADGVGNAGLGRAGDFAALARLGPGPKRNHLATIYLDGNAVGRFFGGLADDASLGREAKQQLSGALAEATWSALTTATATVLRDADAALPVMAHLVGGDDVLVTLPAARAVAFATSFLEAFTASLKASVTAQVPGFDSAVPTCSAGIVFTHQSHPFNRTQRTAAGALRAAKQIGRGEAASLAWVDITRHGEGPPPHRGWTLEELAARGSAVSELAALPASATSRLADLLSAEHHPRVQAALLASEPTRLGLSDTLVDYLGEVDGRGEPANPVEASIDLARWWPEAAV